VRKIDGRCFDGARNGRETGVDLGGGCGYPGAIDDFEAGTLDFTFWTTVEGAASVVAHASGDSRFALQVPGYGGTPAAYGAAATRELDTSACTTVYVDFGYKRANLYYQYVYLDYWTGSTWNNYTYIYSTGSGTDASFNAYTIHLSGTTAAHPNFRFRFRSTASGTTSVLYVDNLYIGCADPSDIR
jgi:hypothetical protein